jgi:hypothetical protein
MTNINKLSIRLNDDTGDYSILSFWKSPHAFPTCQTIKKTTHAALLLAWCEEEMRKMRRWYLQRGHMARGRCQRYFCLHSTIRFPLGALVRPQRHSDYPFIRCVESGRARAGVEKDTQESNNAAQARTNWFTHLTAVRQSVQRSTRLNAHGVFLIFFLIGMLTYYRRAAPSFRWAFRKRSENKSTFWYKTQNGKAAPADC